MKNDSFGGRVYSPTDVTSYQREVCTRYTSALTPQQAKPGNGSGAPEFHHKGH